MKRFSFMVLAIGAIAMACSDDDGSYLSGPAGSSGLRQAAEDPEQAAMQALLDDANAQLDATGADYRVGVIEWLDDNGEGVNTVFFKTVGNKQLAHHFVPGDPRRGGRTNITYLVDKSGDSTDPTAVGQTEAAIDRAMATWDGVTCSTFNMTKNVDTGADPDLIDELSPQIPDDGTGGTFAADIVHAGWFFSPLFPPNIIAVTFTFIFVGPGGPTDIDNNGKLDVAWREIYYNDQFLWRINANVDVETVALHEAGHGLSQAHFGQAFVTSGNDPFVHFAPRAVMNAGYSGVQQLIGETDNAGHCSIWAHWPQN